MPTFATITGTATGHDGKAITAKVFARPLTTNGLVRYGEGDGLVTVGTIQGSVFPDGSVRGDDGTLGLKIPLETSPVNPWWDFRMEVAGSGGALRNIPLGKAAVVESMDLDDLLQIELTAIDTSIVEDVNAAAALVTAKAAEINAVSATNDGIMALVAADPESDFSARLSATYVASKLPKVSGRAAGLKYDGTDETATVNAIIAGIVAFGVAELSLEGRVRCDGQVVIPHTNTQVSTTPPVRITGAVVHMPGTTFAGSGPYPNAPGLDLRYGGRTDTGCATTLGSDIVPNPNATAADRGLIVTGPGIPDWCWVLAVQAGVSWTLSKPARATGTATLRSYGGRIQGLGYGTLEVDHLMLCNDGATASSAPYILTTGPTVRAHDNLFIGHATKGGALCDEDIWIGGGSGQGTAITSALVAGQSYTTLAVDPLPAAVRNNKPIFLRRDALTGQTQAVTTSGISPKGATTITVQSFTAVTDFPARTGVSLADAQDFGVIDSLSVPSAAFQGYGGQIYNNHFHRMRRIAFGMYTSSVNVDKNSWMHNCGSNLAKAPSTLTAALVKGTAYTTLAVTGLSIPANVGDVLQVGAGDVSQETVVATAAAAGATSVTVSSFTANADYSTAIKVWNTTAGLGAAVASFADPSALNAINMTGNRVGMSGGFSCAFRGMGATRSSTIAYNDIQDVQANPNYIAAYRFDRGAFYNLVLRGLGFNEAVDDWSDVTGAFQQTFIDTLLASKFPNGIRLKNRLYIRDPSALPFQIQDDLGNVLLNIGGALKTWGVRGAMTIEGIAGVASSSALTIGNNSTDSNAILTLNPPAGRQSTIQFKIGNVNGWLVSQPNATELRFTDSVNGTVVLGLTQGAGSTAKARFSGLLRPGQDTTANRPTGLNNTTDRGSMFWDLTLGKPVFWVGSAGWVDASGAAA